MTQAYRDDGRIEMIGIVQEQHPERARLFMQWKQMGWPVMVDALNLLDLSDKRFARPLAKLVRSALANAEQKNERDSAGIDIDNLIVGKILVDQGPNMWRIRPRAQGRASWLQKKTCNVRIELSEEN